MTSRSRFATTCRTTSFLMAGKSSCLRIASMFVSLVSVGGGRLAAVLASDARYRLLHGGAFLVLPSLCSFSGVLARRVAGNRDRLALQAELGSLPGVPVACSHM